MLRLDPARWALRVVHRPELADAEMFRVDSGAVAAINGIYFDPNYKPLGLLVSAGVELSRLRRVDHGVFAIAAAGPGLQHARSYDAPPGLDFAAECGPRLVVDGKALQLKPSLARRSAIAHDAEGRVLLVASAAVVSLHDLAAVLARPVAEGGLGAVAAMNLDGGSSTMFDLALAGRRVAIRSAVRVPIGLVVVPRQAGEVVPSADVAP